MWSARKKRRIRGFLTILAHKLASVIKATSCRWQFSQCTSRSRRQTDELANELVASRSETGRFLRGGIKTLLGTKSGVLTHVKPLVYRITKGRL